MKHLLLILALSATVMLTGLGASRLWDDDEPRNAGCAREMLARWDWIVPWFNNELRAHKPVLTYWCMMLSYLLLGESEFSARLPSALAAIGTTLLTYAIGRRIFSPQAALWAALILPTTMLFAMAGRIATPDSLLIFCVTLTMAVYVWTAWPVQEGNAEGNYENYEKHESGTEGPRWFFPRTWWQAAAIYAAMGLAVLSKGPVGLVLPTAIIGMFLLVVRWGPGMWSTQAILHFFRTAWSMRPFTAMAVVAIVACPWYLAVGYQTEWQFLEEFFVKHNLHRATGAMEGHRGGIWFYPVMLLAGFFPWSIFAIPLGLETFAALNRQGRERASVLFLLCWVGVWIGAFTIATTKLASYATPCFPAIALLCGQFVERLLRGQMAIKPYWPQVSFVCLSLAGLLAAIALPWAAHRFLPGDEWLAVLAIPPLLGGMLCLFLWRSNRPAQAMAGMVASAMALVLGVFGVGAHAVDRHQQAGRMLARLHQLSDRPQVGSYKVLEPSWVYYGKTPIREMHNSPADVIAFLEYSSNRFVITTEEHWQSIASQKGHADVMVLSRVNHFLKDDSLVLIGHRSSGVARRPSTQR